MDGAMDGDMVGDMAGMDDMDGMDGDMDAMDGDMDMDGDAPVLGEDGEELPAEDEEEAKASDDANQDFSKDPSKFHTDQPIFWLWRIFEPLNLNRIFCNCRNSVDAEVCRRNHELQG